MNSMCTRLLLAGEYICAVRYRQAFEILQDQGERDEVNAWLGALNMRLARVREDGAFFMAPLVVSVDDQAKLRRELLAFRDVYGPAVQLLDFIRQADSLGLQLSPGELIPLYELEKAVLNSGTLEILLRSRLSVIHEGNARNTVRENLRRLLMHLAKDGYLHLASKETEMYQVTGKIDQLYVVLDYLSNSGVAKSTDVDESEVADPDLVDQAGFDEELE